MPVWESFKRLRLDKKVSAVVGLVALVGSCWTAYTILLGDYLSENTKKEPSPIVKSSQVINGYQSPSIVTDGNVTVNFWDTGKEQEILSARYEEKLKNLEKRLLKKLENSNSNSDNKQQQNLELRLRDVQEKLDNLEKSYSKVIKSYEIADKALDQFKDQLPAVQLAKARTNLRQGKTEAAEKAFDYIVARGGEAIASAAYQSGQLAESRLDYTKALRQYKLAIALDEYNTQYLRKAAWLLIRLENDKEAEELYRRALPIVERNHARYSIEVASAINDLAYAYTGQGKNKEAEELYRRALPIVEHISNKDSSQVAVTLSHLARACYQQGKYKEAGKLLRRSLPIYEKAFGENNGWVLKNLEQLEIVYRKQGKLVEADLLHNRILSISKKPLIVGPSIITSIYLTE